VVDRATVFYDADCGFCRWSAERLRRWDRRGRLRFAPLTSNEAERVLGDLPDRVRFDSWHLLDEAGQVSSAGAAIPPLLQRLPGGTPVATVAARFPRATDRAYRWVADHRDLFGRFLPRSACAVRPDDTDQRSRSNPASSPS
jgi:predicted DCC family thiol-disulfide oxidoreductase YuxK